MNDPDEPAPPADPWAEAHAVADAQQGALPGAGPLRIALLVLALGAALVLVVQLVGCLVRSGVTYRVRLADATGLSEGAPVTYRNHPIGEVIEVRVSGRDLVAEVRLASEAQDLVRTDARWTLEVRGPLDATRSVVLVDPGSGGRAPYGHAFDSEAPGLPTRIWTPAIATIVLLVAGFLLLRGAGGFGTFVGAWLGRRR